MPASDLDAFMATMVAPSVPISCGDAEKFACELYDLRATATRLTGERDENFKLVGSDGRESRNSPLRLGFSTDGRDQK